uniref:Uncharacterized protein n=1 Tax=Steinernema glaseri TaxID=37863 RepID=A0A1I7ZT80_9BILA
MEPRRALFAPPVIDLRPRPATTHNRRFTLWTDLCTNRRCVITRNAICTVAVPEDVARLRRPITSSSPLYADSSLHIRAGNICIFRIALHHPCKSLRCPMAIFGPTSPRGIGSIATQEVVGRT